MREVGRSKQEARRTVIVWAGMPGAGKSLATSVAKRMGIPVFVSGDVVRLEAARRGLRPTRRNLGRLMIDLRNQDGMGAIAKRVKPMIDASGARVAIYEGARSMEELDELRRDYKLQSVCIHASPQTRYRRLVRRGRSDRPRSWAQFLERDERELSVGLGKVIAYSDRMIENESSKDNLRRQTSRILKSALT